MDDRLVAIWDDGTYINTMDLEFQDCLSNLVEQLGPPSKVEFRRADEGPSQSRGSHAW
jgi:hypothetical protein